MAIVNENPVCEGCGRVLSETADWCESCASRRGIEGGVPVHMREGPNPDPVAAAAEKESLHRALVADGQDFDAWLLKEFG